MKSATSGLEPGNRCIVCYPSRPFVEGGTERLVSCTARRLKERGFRVETLALPSLPGSETQVLYQALQWASLDLGAAYPDAWVITTKFPSYLLHHPRKVVWLFHQYREIYDLYGDRLSSFKNEVLDHDIRETLMRMDRQALSSAHRLYCISDNVANRLKNYLGLTGRVLYPPSPLFGRLRSEAPGDYVLAVSRLDANKRVDLLLEALSCSTDLHARIAGEGPLGDELEEKARQSGVRDRASFLGHVSEETLLDLYAKARAVFVGPIDEDYGLTTVEALGAGRPVVATSDSGGPLEFVVDEVNGLVVEPQPEKVAQALFRLRGDDDLCARLGAAGVQSVRGLRWDDVITELTS